MAKKRQIAYFCCPRFVIQGEKIKKSTFSDIEHHKFKTDPIEYFSPQLKIKLWDSMEPRI